MTETERKNYHKAKRYLYKIDPVLYKDILHDAYLTYYRRTGLNLFERSNGNVIGVVRNQWWEYLRSLMYKKNGERFSYFVTQFDDHSVDTVTPIDILIAKETYNIIDKRADSFNDPDRAREILKLRLEGYSRSEIAETLNTSNQIVRNALINFQKDRPGKKKTSDDTKEKMRQDSENGMTLNQLCIKYKVSLRTAWKTVNYK